MRRVQGSVGHPEAEGDQGVGLLRVLPHRLPGQEDGHEVLPMDRVSATSPIEAGSTGEGDSCQGQRTSATAAPRGSQRSGPRP
jgi:hypothetical protein